MKNILEIEMSLLKRKNMKKWMLLFISLFSLFFCFPFVIALEVNKLPPLEWYITDFTDTLTLDQLNELEAIAENYAEKTTNQLIAVVIPDRQGRELFDIGIKLFNENGIGTTANNGLLLLISKEENQMQSGPVRSNGKIRIIV
jgi:uncharacterized membrane protein YgcG